jgi:hypothetical protein
VVDGVGVFVETVVGIRLASGSLVLVTATRVVGWRDAENLN